MIKKTLIIIGIFVIILAVTGVVRYYEMVNRYSERGIDITDYTYEEVKYVEARIIDEIMEVAEYLEIEDYYFGKIVELLDENEKNQIRSTDTLKVRLEIVFDAIIDRYPEYTYVIGHSVQHIRSDTFVYFGIEEPEQEYCTNNGEYTEAEFEYFVYDDFLLYGESIEEDLSHYELVYHGKDTLSSAYGLPACPMGEYTFVAQFQADGYEDIIIYYNFENGHYYNSKGEHIFTVIHK